MSDELATLAGGLSDRLKLLYQVSNWSSIPRLIPEQAAIRN